METKGRIKQINLDWKSRKTAVTVEVDARPDEVERLVDKDLTVVLKQFRQKRSLDANGLLWHCLGKIAEALRTDKWEVYLQMLKRYGQFTYICVKPNMVDAVKAQWRECEVVGDININGQKAIQILVYFGSSTYNTQEFSVLLDGVISEMREMGLELPTSEDMRRALELWEKQNGEKSPDTQNMKQATLG